MLSNENLLKLAASKDTFKHNLRREMNKKFVRAADVCRALSISKNTFSGWYNGRYLPSPLLLEKLCNYFGVTPEEMLNEEAKPKQEVFVSSTNKDTPKATEKLLMLIKAYNDGLLTKEEFMEHKKNL